jgi:hypothetical protein
VRQFPRLSIALLLTFSAFSATAATANADSSLPAAPCRIELTGPKFEASSCAILNGETLVVVKVAPNSAHPTVVKAQFKATNRQDQFAIAKRLWKRLWVESAKQSLTGEEQLELRQAVFLANPSTLSASAHAVLDFLTNFVEPDQRIEELDRTMEPDSLWGFSSIFHYTLICDAIGQVREATFTGAPGAGLTTTLMIVGDPATKCRGRCGASCQQPFQWRKNQYTQECLNHDACRDASGSVFGFCKDEFWAAAFGYLVAPDCQGLPQTPSMPGPSPNEPLPTPADDGPHPPISY